MKTTYIYLNTYPNGYLYIGSHTWDGPEGELDPNYHGSSRIVNYYGWKPIKEEILEVVEGYKLHRERYWIEKYAELYGIADCVQVYYRFSKSWINKYKSHGLLLNCHANDASSTAERAYGRESREKQSRTRKLNGANTRAIEAAIKPESVARCVESRLRNARKCRLSDGFIGNGPEITKHTGFNRSTVSSAMYRANVKGSYLCKGVTFYSV